VPSGAVSGAARRIPSFDARFREMTTFGAAFVALRARKG